MESNVTIKIDALDNSKAAFASVEKNLEGVKTATAGVTSRLEAMAPTFKKIAAVGTVAFAGLVAAGNKSIQAYAEVERAQRQLEHAVIQVSKGTREQVVEIENITAALEKKAGVDADSLKMGAAQLSTFGLQSASVVKLTKSLADLTVNQSGVNATSEDYIQSANNIAKALNGQFGVLERSGIRFTEAQQQLILFGKESEKVAALQEGFAQNLRETTDTVAGVDLASAKMRRTMENISENLGKALVPAFAKLAETVQPIIERFAAWSEENPELLAKIVMIGGAVASLAVVLGTLGLILPPIIAGFGLLAAAILAVTWPIVAIVAALAAVGGGIYLLWKNWDDVMGWITNATETATSYVSQTFSAAMNAISNAITASWEAIKTAFTTSINFIVGLYATLLDYLVPGWDAMLLSLFNSASRVLGEIVTFLSGALTTISTVFGAWFLIFKAKWTALWESAKAVFVTIWQSLKAAFDTVSSGIKSSMESLVKPIQKVIDLAERAYALAGGVVKKAGGYVSSTVSSILDRGSAITGKAVGGYVSPNTPYKVGELGEELFVPSTAGRIFNGAQLAGGGQGAAIFNIHITGNSFMGEKDMAERIGDQLVNIYKQNGRL